MVSLPRIEAEEKMMKNAMERGRAEGSRKKPKMEEKSG